MSNVLTFRGKMRDTFQDAIREVLSEMERSGEDQHGFINFIPVEMFEKLSYEWVLYCRKHNLPIRMARKVRKATKKKAA